MITWILGIILIVFCIFKRFGKDGKVERQPLGMPRGTVRGLITLLIVSFPFTYLLNGQEIPGLITNAIFILVAFYFQSRKSGKDRLKRIINEMKNPEKIEEKEKLEKKPLYLPKFTVRFLLIVMLALIIIINTLGPNVAFETTNTLFDLLIIICLFIVGAFFRGILVSGERKKVVNQIKNMQDYENLSKYEILIRLIEQKPSWLKQKGKNFLSILILAAVITALLCYTINWDYTILFLSYYEFSLRATLLLLINVYYGFRD